MTGSEPLILEMYRRRKMAKSEGSFDKVEVPYDEYDTQEKLVHLCSRLIAVVDSLSTPRSVKEAALAKIRSVEQKTGRRVYGEYNGASRNPSEMARVEEENKA